MFEKLFVKTSDFVFHTIAPYAVERERFLEHCGEEGFSKGALRRIAGIVVTAACDLHAHGGLDVDQKRLESAAALLIIEKLNVVYTNGKPFARNTTGALKTQQINPPIVRRRQSSAVFLRGPASYRHEDVRRRGTRFPARAAVQGRARRRGSGRR